MGKCDACTSSFMCLLARLYFCSDATNSINNGYYKIARWPKTKITSGQDWRDLSTDIEDKAQCTYAQSIYHTVRQTLALVTSVVEQSGKTSGHGCAKLLNQPVF